MSQIIQFIACILEINSSVCSNGEKTEVKKKEIICPRRILRMTLDRPCIEAGLPISGTMFWSFTVKASKHYFPFQIIGPDRCFETLKEAWALPSDKGCNRKKTQCGTVVKKTFERRL